MIALAISLISQLPQHLFSVEVAAFCPFSGISFPKVYENHTEKCMIFIQSALEAEKNLCYSCTKH